MSDTVTSLLDGNKLFRKKFFSGDSTLFNELLLQGQRPKVLIVGCSDSRVNPDLIFNCEPGELFTVRNVAGLVPPFESKDIYPATGAALEFGACFLKVKHIILLGHSHCGGIQTVVERGSMKLTDKSDNLLKKWLELVQPACEKVLAEHPQASLEDQVNLCGRSTLVNSLDNLYSFPWIRKRVHNNEILLHAWYFDLATGEIHIHDQEKDRWIAP